MTAQNYKTLTVQTLKVHTSTARGGITCKKCRFSRRVYSCLNVKYSIELKKNGGLNLILHKNQLKNGRILISYTK